VTGDDFYIHRVSVDSSFHHSLEVLGQFMRDNNFASNTYEDYQSYVEAAYYLYTVFLKPLEEKIADRRLLIIPDRELGYIPFEALLTNLPEAGGMDYRSLPYLVYQNRTNYSYSATLYFSENKERKEAARNLLAFAPTYENIGEISSEKFPTYREYSTYLVPLRFISTEIRNISEIIDADKFEAYDATEMAFKENAPKYNILHLAMHTLINNENPLYSNLVFTMNNDTLEENDGLLHAYEIFNMQLNARMAVLSACNTGYGKLQKGEGVMSMARGFIFAGVPSIIMTLWAVEDQSGSILMSKFYSNLVEGMEIDEALQEAKLQYLQEADQLSAHPYLWSGYVSIGSTDAIIKRSWDTVYILLVAFLVLLPLVWFFIKKRLSRRRRA
jgi:CHAT domain-containing protein